jgi:hypothetical protein
VQKKLAPSRKLDDPMAGQTLLAIASGYEQVAALAAARLLARKPG